MSTALGLGAVLVLVLLNAFFVAAEFALVAVDRSRVRERVRAGVRRAKLVERLLGRLSFHLSGAQLGITVTSLMLGFIAEPAVADVVEPAVEGVVGEGSAPGLSVAIALSLATIFQMLFGELVPKNIAIARPLRSALALGPLIQVYGTLSGLLIRFLNGAANGTVRRLGVEPREELASIRSMEEFELLIRASGEEGTLDPTSVQLLTRSLRFGDKVAADALVPRVEVDAVATEATVADLVAAAGETGHSRFPIYGEDLDDIVGVVHVKDVYGLPIETRGEEPVTAIMREPFVVPESRDLDSLLSELQRIGAHLAVVVDEYGGTAGIITVEDLLEEIVGEIDDEHDEPTMTVVRRPGEYVLPASLHPDEVEEACGLELPPGPYETLAGFALDRLGHIPVAGERVEHDGWSLEVRAMDKLRIATVRIFAPPVVRHPSETEDGEP